MLNGKKIDKNKTLEENKIKNDDILVLQVIDLKINYITIYFTSVDQKIQEQKMICRKTETFAIIEQDLYKKYPDFKETGNNYFLSKGAKINRNKTLEENNIENNDVILLGIDANDE